MIDTEALIHCAQTYFHGAAPDAVAFRVGKDNPDETRLALEWKWTAPDGYMVWEKRVIDLLIPDEWLLLDITKMTAQVMAKNARDTMRRKLSAYYFPEGRA